MTQAPRNFGFLRRVEEKHGVKGPDMEGELTIDGVRYRLAGWIKISKKGAKYCSLEATRQAPSASPGKGQTSEV